MKCKLCGNKAERRQDDRRFFQCQICGLIFKDEKYILTADAEKMRYQEHNNSIENEGYVNMFRQFLDKAVLPFVQPEADVLDFGAGPGPVLAELMSREGFSTTIYDPYFFPDMDYKEKKYDLITSTEVFEHFFNPRREIKHLISLLKDGGLLAVMTNFYTEAGSFADWWYIRDDTHISLYSPKTFRWVEDNFPLEIIYTNNSSYISLKKI